MLNGFECARELHKLECTHVEIVQGPNLREKIMCLEILEDIKGWNNTSFKIHAFILFFWWDLMRTIVAGESKQT